MRKKKHNACPSLDIEQLLLDVQSPEEQVRAKAVRSLCPCHAGWQIFEQHIEIVDRLRKDPSPRVRAHALHVFEDAGEMDSSGYPTSPRALSNDLLRKRLQSRFRPDEESQRRQKIKRERYRERDAGKR